MAHVGITNILGGILVVERFAELAVAPHGVVLTIVTDPTTGVACGQIHSHIEVALVRMFVAVALCGNSEEC